MGAFLTTYDSTTMASQALSLAANFTLKLWGEANRESGGNDGQFKYLLGYGLFSLLSIAGVAIGGA